MDIYVENDTQIGNMKKKPSNNTVIYTLDLHHLVVLHSSR